MQSSIAYNAWFQIVINEIKLLFNCNFGLEAAIYSYNKLYNPDHSLGTMLDHVN